jgi:hypothetical protein
MSARLSRGHSITKTAGSGGIVGYSEVSVPLKLMGKEDLQPWRPVRLTIDQSHSSQTREFAGFLSPQCASCVSHGGPRAESCVEQPCVPSYQRSLPGTADGQSVVRGQDKNIYAAFALRRPFIFPLAQRFFSSIDRRLRPAAEILPRRLLLAPVLG